jgi:ferredoxin--NADP+ reductase
MAANHQCTQSGKNFPILRRRMLTPGSDGIFELVVEAPLVARHARAGQFVIVRSWDGGERIPLTIAAYDREAGTISLIVQMVGYSTRRMGDLAEGDPLLDLLGPLGTPIEVRRFEDPVVVIGGGVGIAPIWPKVKEHREIGNTVLTIIGAREKRLLILEEELRALSSELVVTTDDGSYGRKGLVTEPLREIARARAGRIAEVIAVGPLPMMQAVVRELAGADGRYDPATQYAGGRIPCVVSLNPIMVDGTGMCGGCRVNVWDPVQSHYEARFSCVDGPAFDGYRVDFAGLAARNRQYREQERVAHERAPEPEV